jgi:predicted MFS family arabinose efflux permease
VNVVVAVAATLAGRAVLPHDRGYQESRIDPISGLLVTGGLMAVVLGCAQAASHGWGSTEVLVPGVVGIVLIAVFLVRQGRMQQPLLPLWLLRDRRRAGAYAAVAVSVVGSFGMFLMLTYHFQVVLGWTPVQAGLAFLPLSAAVSGSAYGLGSRLLPKVAPRALIAPGLAIAAAGLLLLTTLTPSSGYATVILPAEVLLGVGMGLVFTPAISVVTSAVEPRYAGVAAATANTAMQIGSSVGTAVLNSLAVGATASYVAAHRLSGTGGTHDALVHGYATAIGWSALALAVVAVLVVVLVNTPNPKEKEK